MAKQDTKQPGTQSAEDMFGRPTSPRHDAEPATRPGTRGTPVQDHTGSRKSTEEEDEHDAGGLDDIPDGDGPRSDRGTNPLPEAYWAGYPDKES